MSDPTLIQASQVTPAYEGEVTVTSITAGAAAAAITVTTPGYTTISIDDGAGVAVGCYLTAKNGADPAAPAPTATSGTGRTQFYSAADLRALVFVAGDRIRVYAIGTGTHYVRQSPSSPA